MFVAISKISVFFLLIFLTFCVSDVRGRFVNGLENRNQTESNTTQEEAGNETVAVADSGNCDVIICKNGGTCKVDQGKTMCDCPDGLLGKYCEVVLKDICSEYKPECAETGGSCILDKKRQVQCVCPNGTEFNSGCYAPDETCSHLKPLCEKTRGSCSFDKYGRFICRCPNGTQYGQKSGCIPEEILCSKNKPYCEETGGVCVSDEDTQIQCECPNNLWFKKFYGDEIGCQTEDDACAYMKPNCSETGGMCFPKGKNREIGCFCLDNNYEHGIGCHGNSSSKDWDNPLDKLIDPRNDRINSRDDGPECLNGGQRFVFGKTVKCMCKKPYSGEFCEKKDRCDGTKCDCPDDFIGRTCEIHLKDLCSQYKPGCGKTGGSCILDKNREVQCICPEGTVYNHGCHAPNETCSHLKPLCEETGGSCVFDKHARLVCICPDRTQYFWRSGCINEENWCSKNKPKCEETGGVCVLDENTEIQCECPRTNVIDYWIPSFLPIYEKIYGLEIGCHDLDYLCSELKPNCNETGGICLPHYKTGGMECICTHGHYTLGIGCHDDSIKEILDDVNDPWDKVTADPPEDGHKCLNGGRHYVIKNTSKCICEKPFSGEFCEKGPCSSNPCLNSGICRVNGNGFTCKCKKGFSGKLCENDPCSGNPCLNNGICRFLRNGSFTCICQKPFSGKLCEYGPCSSNPCLNRGICRDKGNGFTCMCKKPFSGKLCENDPCSSKPCLNNGICHVRGNSYTCECEESFNGKSCANASQRKTVIFGILYALGGLICLVGIFVFCLIFHRPKTTVRVVHQQSPAPAAINPLEPPIRN